MIQLEYFNDCARMSVAVGLENVDRVGWYGTYSRIVLC